MPPNNGLKALEEKIIELEGQIRLLKGQSTTATPTNVADSQSTPTATTPSAVPAEESAGRSINLGGAKNAGKVLNPDISVIGDFTGAAGRNKFSPVRSLEMHESEIGLQAIIDPYARGDFFISFGEQGVNVEEGFITFTSLPGNFVVKAGKMRSAFGKVNTMHNHVLPWIDRPLVSENLSVEKTVLMMPVFPSPAFFLHPKGYCWKRPDNSSVAILPMSFVPQITVT